MNVSFPCLHILECQRPLVLQFKKGNVFFNAPFFLCKVLNAEGGGGGNGRLKIVPTSWN